MDFPYQNQPMYLKEEDKDYISKGLTYNHSPHLVFLHERIIVHLQELAFYLLRLNKLGINNEKIKWDFLDAYSSMVLEMDYTPEEFSEIITKLYIYMSQAKELYISVCQRNNLKPEILKTILKNPKKLNLSDLSEMVIEGERSYAKRTKGIKPEQGILGQMLFNTVKVTCIHLIALKGFDIDNEKGYISILSAFNEGNTFKKYLNKRLIEEFAKLNHTLAQELEKAITARYSEISSVEISTSVRPNKAILVSGSNLRELELLLEATKDKEIDVYTYGDMIVAHAYPKFKTYTHLAGHISPTSENCSIDFSNFPGSILMTRHSLQRAENLYRGGIYTTDIIALQGIVTIKNNNFEPLITSALRAEGFTETIKKQPIKIALDEKSFHEKIAEVAQKIEEGQIKHFFVIGSSDYTKAQKEYFDKFLNSLGNDCFVLSFSYTNGRDNVLYIKFNDYWPTLFYKALEVLTKKIKITDLNPVILYTKCGFYMFSDIIYLKNAGINQIYLPVCSTNLFNPFFIDFFKKMFDLKEYTKPEEDLKEMLNG